MSDNLDIAAQNQLVIDCARLTQRREILPIHFNGLCHYCEESVEEPKLYCSGSCATLHDKQLNHR